MIPWIAQIPGGIIDNAQRRFLEWLAACSCLRAVRDQMFLTSLLARHLPGETPDTHPPCLDVVSKSGRFPKRWDSLGDVVSRYSPTPLPCTNQLGCHSQDQDWGHATRSGTHSGQADQHPAESKCSICISSHLLNQGPLFLDLLMGSGLCPSVLSLS